MPLPLAGALAAIAPWITRFLMVKGALLFSGFLGRLGLVIATNEVIVQPLVDHVIAMWSLIPADMQCWLALFGATKSASIIVSALTLLAAKQVFFRKA